MSIETTIYATLNAIAPTWPTVCPADAPTPRITYQLVAGADTPTYDADGTGAKFGRWQIDVWAPDYGTARGLAEQARAALYEALMVGEMMDNPSDFDPSTELHKASFDVKAWA